MSKQGEGHSRKKNKNKKKLDRAVSHAGARYQESASPFFRRLRIHIGSAVAYLSRRRRHATTMCAVLVRFSINHPFRIRTQLRVCVSPLPPLPLHTPGSVRGMLFEEAGDGSGTRSCVCCEGECEGGASCAYNHNQPERGAHVERRLPFTYIARLDRDHDVVQFPLRAFTLPLFLSLAILLLRLALNCTALHNLFRLN